MKIIHSSESTSSDGEIVRVVFERIDPSLIDPKKLKGVLIDNNA
jgi:hypothetical protein